MTTKKVTFGVLKETITSTKKKNNSFYSMKFDDIAYPRSVLDLCGAKSRFYDVQYLTYTAFVSVYTDFVTIILHNKGDINCDFDHDPVHCGVVCAYIYILCIWRSSDPIL